MEHIQTAEQIYEDECTENCVCMCVLEFDSVFLSLFLPYHLRKGLPMNIELSHSGKLTRQKAPVMFSSLSISTGITNT